MRKSVNGKLQENDDKLRKHSDHNYKMRFDK